MMEIQYEIMLGVLRVKHTEVLHRVEVMDSDTHERSTRWIFLTPTSVGRNVSFSFERFGSPKFKAFRGSIMVGNKEKRLSMWESYETI
jgi:hypothetical protein